MWCTFLNVRLAPDVHTGQAGARGQEDHPGSAELAYAAAQAAGSWAVEVAILARREIGCQANIVLFQIKAILKECNT